MFKILIVDDSRVNLKTISSFLGTEYEVLLAEDGQTAIQIAMEKAPDLILLDVIMPGMDGLTVCRLLKRQESTMEIPIIFITVVSGVKDIVKALEAGGQDYITKPFCALELRARIRTHLELKKSKEVLKAYAKQLEAKNQELNQMLKRLEVVAVTDYLTNLPNRRYMTKRINEEVDRSKRSQRKMTLIMADIDSFKKINDTYGHDCGDLVLKKVSEIMQSNTRKQDVISRWGGEEFLLMLPETDVDGGRNVAEKIQAAIAADAIHYGEKEILVTITLGVAEFDFDLDVDENIKRADKAMYIGKQIGCS